MPEPCRAATRDDGAYRCRRLPSAATAGCSTAIASRPRSTYGDGAHRRVTARVARRIVRQMKKPRTMSLRETKARLSEAISAAQGSYVLVTRHGKPAAVIVGVDGADVLDVVKRFSALEKASS